MEDDSLVDNPATDIGMEQTMNWMVSILATSRPAARHKLQSCICRWAKITSTIGLRIHQGRKGSLKKGQQESCIDSYFLRSRTSQSTEVQQQDRNQSLQDFNKPIPAKEETDMGKQPKHSLIQPKVEKKFQGQKNWIKCSQSCKKAVWEEVTC